MVRLRGCCSEAIVVRRLDETTDRTGAKDFQIRVGVAGEESQLVAEVVVAPGVELIGTVAVGDGVEKESGNWQRRDGQTS